MPGQGKGQLERVGAGWGGTGRLLFVYAKRSAGVKVKAKAREVVGVLVPLCTAPFGQPGVALSAALQRVGAGPWSCLIRCYPVFIGHPPPPPHLRAVLSFSSVSWRVIQGRETEARRQD